MFVGKAHVVVREGDKIVHEQECENFVTDAGLKHIAAQLGQGDADGAMSHMGVGTGTGQTKASNALATQKDSRQALTAGYPDVTASPADNVVVYVATFAAGTWTDTLTEAGVFNDATSGSMLNYFNFSPPIDKQSTQSLTVTLSLTVGSLSS